MAWHEQQHAIFDAPHCDVGSAQRCGRRFKGLPDEQVASRLVRRDTGQKGCTTNTATVRQL